MPQKLARYVETRQAKDGLSYHFIPPKDLRSTGLMQCVALGKDAAEARLKALELNRKLDELRGISVAQEPAIIQHKSVADLVQRYLDSPAYKGKEASTQKAYKGALEAALGVQVEGQPWGSCAVSSVRYRHSDDLYERLSHVHGSLRASRIVSTYRWIWKYAIRWEWTEINPFKGQDLEKPAQSRSVVWTKQELDRVCIQAQEMGRYSVASAVRLAYATGQRISDILALRCGDYVAGMLTLTTRKTKHVVNVPALSADLVKLFEGEPNDPVIKSEVTGQSYSYSAFWLHWDRARQAAGVEAKRFHDIRHTVATEYGDAGASDSELMAAIGWRNRSSVTKYTKATLSQAKSASEKRKQMMENV